MTLKLKLTTIITVMILIVIAIISIINVSRSANLQKNTTYQYANEMGKANSIEIQRRVEAFLNYASILSQVFSDYETTNESSRRAIYDDLLESTIEQNNRIMGIFTAWYPNTIDSYDSRLGQYQAFYSRRSGSVEFMPEGYEGWQDYLAQIQDKPILADPVWRDIVGFGNVPIISVQYPVKNSEGRVVGLVGINYVSLLQEIADNVAKEIYNGEGMTGIYTNEGTIIAHFDRTRVKDNMRTNPAEINVLGNDMNRVLNAIKTGQLFNMDKYSANLETDVHFIYYPINFTGIDTPWCLMLVIPMDEINRPIVSMVYFTLIFSLIILVTAAVITFFISQNIVKPIVGVTQTLKDISEGEGDLTRVINVKSKDEVGSLAQYFNKTLEKIKGLVIIIKNEAKNLSSIGSDLASNMNETAAAVNEITANIQSIKGRVINQSASVTETNATMEQLVGNIKKLDGHVEKQSVNVSQASSAIEEMVANIRSVTETLVKNDNNIKALTGSSEIGRNGLHEVAEDIQGIARDSEGLLEINSVMENIASQTNLLSMNAAIEAAHAGDAGKGFAVVADEIRKLAESSSEQSKTIGSVLKKIKGAIEKISESTANVLDKFEAINSSVKTVAEQEEMIRNAMEEQGEGSKQTLEGVENVNEITRQVTSSTTEMLQGAKEVMQESNNLERVTQEITAGMNEMATGAEQINIAVNQVNEISSKNREGIETLMREVSRFKVE
ncbi:MAG: methyl-accepting chemotaxis protein [Treponema sp.]|jgi:methyl-accepting chemotaxis protein|nr:methyl-accepting chemotaxis protein [Treponema sp.]